MKLMKIRDPKDRFNEKYKVLKNECWKWTGSTRKWGGYGQFYFDRKPESAHIASYKLFVGKIPKGKRIDHICLNRICVNPKHLRLCTQQQNTWNQPKSRGSTSKYKGVCFEKDRGKWKADITKNYKCIFLGRFKKEKEAALAYNKAAKKHFGEFANLNKV